MYVVAAACTVYVYNHGNHGYIRITELLLGHGFHGNRIYKIKCTFVDAFLSDLSLSHMWVLFPNLGKSGGGASFCPRMGRVEGVHHSVLGWDEWSGCIILS